MERVWLLWFEQQRDIGEDTEMLIGVYESEEAAKAAAARLVGQPGFRDYPQGFNVYVRILNQDSWTERFVRM